MPEIKSIALRVLSILSTIIFVGSVMGRPRDDSDGLDPTPLAVNDERYPARRKVLLKQWQDESRQRDGMPQVDVFT